MSTFRKGQMSGGGVRRGAGSSGHVDRDERGGVPKGYRSQEPVVRIRMGTRKRGRQGRVVEEVDVTDRQNVKEFPRRV